jgi:phosphomannomutase
MALLLDAMAARDTKISELSDELPRYEIHKAKIQLSREKLLSVFAAVERRFADARADRLDGLRLDWPHKWLLIRPSNTEPIVRVFAEAPTAAEAEWLCAQTEELISGNV